MDNIENTVQTEVATQEQTVNDVKTYTEDEVLALIQSEADKRVNQALKTQQIIEDNQNKKDLEEVPDTIKESIKLAFFNSLSLLIL